MANIEFQGVSPAVLARDYVPLTTGQQVVKYNSGWAAPPSGAAAVAWNGGTTQPPQMAASDVWLHVDPNEGYHWQRDQFTVGLSGPVVITLGTPPITNSEELWRGTTRLFLTTDYTVSGAVVTLLSSTAGDVIRIRYAYRDQAAPASATTDQPVVVVQDSFTRGNSTTSLGTPTELGPAWTALRGTWGINTNQAYLASNPSLNDVAYQDAGKSDYTVQVKVTTSGASGAGLCTNIVDADNCVTTNATGIFVRTAATNTSLATFSTALSDGDTIRIKKSGNNLTVYRQAASTGAFTQVAAVATTQGATSHLVGIRTRSTFDARLDDFWLGT